MRNALALTLTLTTALGAGLAQAQTALVIDNSGDTRGGLLGGSSLTEGLRDAGFDVTASEQAGVGDLRNSLSLFLSRLDPAQGPVVVALSGDFLHGTGGAYLLPDVGRSPRGAAEVLTDALPVDAVLTALSAYPGEAVLLIGDAGGAEGFAPWLSEGAGPIDAPQGVTVLRGPAGDVGRFATRTLLTEGTPLVSAAREAGLSVEGYASADMMLVSPPVATPTPVQQGGSLAESDDAAWQLAQQLDSASAYRLYLNGFPEGRYADRAQSRLAAIDGEPGYDARQTEESLDLSREARQKIQRDLSILGYNTRGIDGIFGAGTRAAIEQWQTKAGFEVTSYLNATQIAYLADQSQERATELEEEARRAAAERRARDEALWAKVSGPEDEEGLRAYLDTFPEGQEAEQARDWLDQITAAREDRAALEDRAAWEDAKSRDTVAAYNSYLTDRPDGAFVDQARERIDAKNTDQMEEAASAQESALGLNPITRRLAEARLAQIGLDPGTVDGSFDGKTRAAIRAYQRDRELDVTGYLNQATVVRLLADGLMGG